MPLHWVIVHPITESSPLRGLTLDSLAAAEPEVVCLINADDETPQHARILMALGLTRTNDLNALREMFRKY